MTTKVKTNIDARARSKARRFVIQALYEWHISANNYKDILKEYNSGVCASRRVDSDYFSLLFSGVASNVEAIDNQLAIYIDRNLNELDPVELAILRAGCFELQECLDVPYSVVINESIELCKCFGAEDSYKYINGIMDKLASSIRSEL